MLTGHPFDDLKTVLDQLPEADTCAAKKVAEALKAKPLPEASGIGGMLTWLAHWQGKAAPAVKETHICILASSYEGQDSASVLNYIEATSKGGAAVNLLCVDKGIGLRAIQLAPEMPHVVDGGWEASDCMASVAFGMEATASGGDILGLTDMAPGNDVYALAMVTGILGYEVVAASAIAEDEAILDAAEALVGNGSYEPLEAMRQLGGREIAASVGAIIAARSRRLPVVAEGWAAIAAVAVLEAHAKGTTDHVLAASYDTSMQEAIWRSLGKKPLVGFPVGAGAGCGVALAISHLSAASALLGLRDHKA